MKIAASDVLSSFLRQVLRDEGVNERTIGLLKL